MRERPRGLDFKRRNDNMARTWHEEMGELY